LTKKELSDQWGNLRISRGVIKGCRLWLGFPTVLFLCVPLCSARGAVPPAAQAASTTAWHDGRFVVDVRDIVGESDIVLARPNYLASQAMPLGNGLLGAAVWSASGMTVQLNRADTLPHRLSPGLVVLPGLAPLTGARDYQGRLDLYNGEFSERGGGMTAVAYVQPDTDMLVIDVTGANPDQVQTVKLLLWPPRAPHASIAGHAGVLAESWADDAEPGASGRRFGSLAALTARGRKVKMSVEGERTIVASFMPLADGTFRVLVPAPHYNGNKSPEAIVSQALLHASANSHNLWWHAFWHRAALIKITSSDGSGEYMENLRDISLFTAAAERGGKYPGSQGGVADLFSSALDEHRWDPAAFWHLNLSMQVAANIGAGVPELNAAYFALYRENLSGIKEWTNRHMSGRPGACVPETMRFNGLGIEYEIGDGSSAPVVALNCDAQVKPFYNARTLSTGAEVSLWVWRQYLATGDRVFLAKNYPIMVAAARFLLAYALPGPDGLLHTSPSNAHETQWDTTDPTTDIAAQSALYTATIEAAEALGKDAALRRQLHNALRRIPPYPRTQETPPLSLLPVSADAGARDVIGDSYVPGATNRNVENIGLYPVWPFGLIGDSSPLLALAKRTFRFRPYPVWPLTADWSFDPIQAARLGLADEVRTTLISLTKSYQKFPNGLASWGGGSGEFYIEQAGVAATALQEALVQDYDGLIRIAPAVAADWNFAGTVFVHGRTKVDVQTKKGVPTTVVIEAGMTERLKLRNPWPGHAIDVQEPGSATFALKDKSALAVSFPVVAGHRYIVTHSNQTIRKSRFAAISGEPAVIAKKLGAGEIGLSSAPPR